MRTHSAVGLLTLLPSLASAPLIMSSITTRRRPSTFGRTRSVEVWIHSAPITMSTALLDRNASQPGCQLKLHMAMVCVSRVGIHASSTGFAGAVIVMSAHDCHT